MAFIELIGRPIAEIEELDAELAGTEEVVETAEEAEAIVEIPGAAVAEDAEQVEKKKD
jgi:hypothetical protein